MDHLICPLPQGLRNRQTERLGGLEVDDQLEPGGLLHRKIAGLGALEDLVHVGGGPSKLVGETRSVSHEASRLRCLSIRGHGGQSVLRGQVRYLYMKGGEQMIPQYEEGTCPP